MKFDVRQRELLTNVFDAFDERNIDYVVLRGYEDLPASVPGSDVDVLVDSAAFGRAMAVCRRHGLDSTDSTVSNVASLIVQATRMPGRAFRLLAESPGKTLSAARRTVSPTEPTAQNYVDRAFAAEGVAVHLVNHLAYASPMNGAKIRVDPSVERAMLDYRRDHDGTEISIPADVDELLHLVCRGVYDYDGAFPDYYVPRCDALVEAISRDEHRGERFETLLEVVFYGAAGLVAECVAAGEYDDIRPRLVRFTDY